MMDAAADSLDGLPTVIQVQPPEAHGNEDGCPFLVHFPTRFVPGSDVIWKVYRHKQRLGHYILVAHTPVVDFVGSTHGRDRAGPPCCTYAVGVLDAESGRMSCSRVEGQQVVSMAPRMRGHAYGADPAPWEERAVTEPPVEEKSSKKDSNKRLVEGFGSTRRKRQLVAQAVAAVNSGSVDVPEGLATLVDEAHNTALAGGTTKEEVLAAVAAARNVPPHNPFASTASEAYSLRELIPGGAWVSLDTKAMLAAAPAPAPAPAGEGEEPPASPEKAPLPPYVQSRLRVLTAPGVDKPTFKLKAKALEWLAALLAMYPDGAVRAPTGLPALARKKGVQADVLEATLDLFYTQSAGEGGGAPAAYSRTDPRRTLMLHYALATALLLEDCDLQPAQFAALRKQLRMKPVEMASHFRELGATATAVKGSAVATPGSPGSEPRLYRITLLPQGDGGPTLAESFPKLKTGRKNAVR